MKELLNITEVLELPLGTRVIIADDEGGDIFEVNPTFCGDVEYGRGLMSIFDAEFLVATTYTLNAKYRIVE